jgi:shikimate kinase
MSGSAAPVRHAACEFAVERAPSTMGDAVRILLTGMSAAGKSTLVTALGALGYRAVDLDDPVWSEYRSLTDDERPAGVEPGRDWVWREDRVAALLSTPGDGVLFVAGCAPNQGRFRRYLDHVVLVTAPVDVTIERLATRSDNPFGKDLHEREKVLRDKATFEPLLRESADLEVETTEPVEATVQRLLALVGSGCDRDHGSARSSSRCKRR